MKALVVQDYGRSPAYTDFPDPAVGRARFGLPSTPPR
ncbi:hypothetical protein GGQ58_003059 [Paracoccus denitrificans]|jgi:hypothetical protein|nr:hypothetical protein [Paracoccus denitrificans]